MNLKYMASIRKRLLAVTLLLTGIILWLSIAILPLTPLTKRLAALGHIEKQSLGVTIGGASIAGGIMLLMIPTRPRKRSKRPRRY